MELAPNLLHFALREHVDHAEHALPAARQNLLAQELHGINHTLCIGASAADIVLELELHGAIAARQRVGVPGVAFERILRHAKGHLLLRLPNHLDVVLDVEVVDTQGVEVLDHGLGRAAGVRLRGLVRLDNIHLVPAEGTGEVFCHSVEGGLECDDLLAHVGRNDGIGLAIGGDLHHLVLIAAGGAHHERALRLGVHLRVRIHGGGVGEVHDDQVLAVLRLHLADGLLLLLRLLRADELHLDGLLTLGDLATLGRAWSGQCHGRQVEAPAEASLTDLVAHGTGEPIHHHDQLAGGHLGESSRESARGEGRGSAPSWQN
mmetsp:Transcript_78657/g.220678  ORF Transcript_78657/g.220678 Transcript_78657/m.220678 type:complete len:318 (+) Transcript_78657:324-1277(+)